MVEIPASLFYTVVGFCAGILGTLGFFLMVSLYSERQRAKREEKMAEAVLKHMDYQD
jgi:hypothetical protein